MVHISNLALIHFRFFKSNFMHERAELDPRLSETRLYVIVARIHILVFDFAPVEKTSISLELDQLRSRTILEPTPNFRNLHKLNIDANIFPLSLAELFNDRSQWRLDFVTRIFVPNFCPEKSKMWNRKIRHGPKLNTEHRLDNGRSAELGKGTIAFRHCASEANY